jgi:tight adherence protein C
MSTALIITLAGVFVFVALVAGSLVSFALTSTATERKRLLASTRAQRLSTLPVRSLATEQQSSGIWQAIGKILPKSPKEMERLRTRLARAGFDFAGAPVIYSLLEIVGPIVGLALPLLYLEGQRAYMAAAMLGIFMYFLPSLVVDRRLSKKRREIEIGLPDALDLLVVCIEAGCGLDQAIVKVSDELALTYPVLAEELRILTAEIRAGKPRIDAFRSLAKRTKVPDVQTLVGTLIQTDKFGTSVGQALRVHADESRTKRRQRAEEAAQKIGVKLVFPLVLCFFPALYAVLLGPAVITFIRVFMKK